MCISLRDKLLLNQSSRYSWDQFHRNKARSIVDEASVKCRATIFLFFSLSLSLSFPLWKNKKIFVRIFGVVISIDRNKRSLLLRRSSFLLLFFVLFSRRFSLFFHRVLLSAPRATGTKISAEFLDRLDGAVSITIGYDHVQIGLAGIISCFFLRERVADAGL